MQPETPSSRTGSGLGITPGLRRTPGLRIDMTDGPLRWVQADGVLEIGVSAPAADDLADPDRAALAGAALRRNLAAALTRGAGDGVRAVVLALDGWDWRLDDSATGPLPGQGPGHGAAGAPGTTDLCALIAGGAVPVIAALSGAVRGAGFDLALAASYTIAHAEARIGCPQVRCGAMPDGGSVQRIAVRIGAGSALDLLLGGRSMTARQALALGLIDASGAADPVETARALAILIARGRQALPAPIDRRRGLRNPAAFLDAVAAARARIARLPLHAAAALVDCVEAALLLPEGEPAATEAALRAELLASDQAAALRHVFWCESRSLRSAPAEAPGTPVHAALRPVAIRPLAIRTVAIHGPAIHAAPLGTTFLGLGCRVILVAPDGPELAEALRRVAVAQDQAVAAGHQSPAAREADWARLQGAVDADLGLRADLVIEAGHLDDEAGARAFFRMMGARAPHGTIIASAAPRDIDALAAVAGRPADVVGLHMARAARHAPVMELTAPDRVSPAAVEGLRALLRAAGGHVIRARDAAGYIGERVFAGWIDAAEQALRLGARPDDLEAMLRDFGWSRLPLPQADMARIAATNPGATNPIGAGTMDRGALRLRMIAAMANEGARLVGQGVVACPGDIDLVLVQGFGYPRWRGGPMHVADVLGIVQMRNHLRALAEAEGGNWAPAPLWDDLVRNARRFADMNG